VLTLFGFGPTAAASCEKNRTASLPHPLTASPEYSLHCTGLASSPLSLSVSDSASESWIPAWTPAEVRRPPPTAGSRAPPTPAAQAPPVGTGSRSTRSPAAGKVRCSSPNSPCHTRPGYVLRPVVMAVRLAASNWISMWIQSRRFGLDEVSCLCSTVLDLHLQI